MPRSVRSRHPLLRPFSAGAAGSLRRAVVPSDRRRRRIARTFVSHHGMAVQGGPFAGLIYVDEAIGSVRNIVPRLLGSYECELHGALERLLAFPHETIVDVGAADGYYAVGLALRAPARSVHAFERDRRRRRLLAKVAAVNGVSERVRIAGTCDVSALRGIRATTALVKVDCEGDELELLRPDDVPLLQRSALLVELHDHIRVGATEIVLSRFASTHDAELIPSRGREARQHPELDGLDSRDARRAIDESRPPMRWAVLLPKAN